MYRRGTKQIDESMTLEKIIDMTEEEFRKWFWEPYGVSEHVGLRHRLTDVTILQVNNSDWIKNRSRHLRDWFNSSAMSIIFPED